VALRPILVLALALFAGNARPQAAGQRSDFDTLPSAEPIMPIPAPGPTDPLKAALGQRLFSDPRLSRADVRSCLTCHDLRMNGAAGKGRVAGLDGTPLRYQPLTVFNAALSFRLSWEGRYRTLEAQLAATLTNPSIMGTSLSEVVDKLRWDPGMVGEFEDAFGHGPDGPSVLEAITTFERTLLTPGCRFDRYLAGDTSALSERELAGYRLFKTLGCIACHQGVNIGGNLFERSGIFHPLNSDHPPPRGEPLMVRVPSLRNIATTPPYFHDGSAATLDEAVRAMGRAQLNSTLTDTQVEAIVAFLGTLTGNYQGRAIGIGP
jgi:cytochrome c peroxidase